MHKARSWERRKETWSEPRNALKENTGQLKDESSRMKQDDVRRRESEDIEHPTPLPLFVEVLILKNLTLFVSYLE